jgi:hypothetical protein
MITCVVSSTGPPDAHAGESSSLYGQHVYVLNLQSVRAHVYDELHGPPRCACLEGVAPSQALHQHQTEAPAAAAAPKDRLCVTQLIQRTTSNAMRRTFTCSA